MNYKIEKNKKKKLERGLVIISLADNNMIITILDIHHWYLLFFGIVLAGDGLMLGTNQLSYNYII